MGDSDLWTYLHIHIVSVGLDSCLVPSHLEHPIPPHSLTLLSLDSPPILGCCLSHCTVTASLVIKVDEMPFF